MSIVKVTTDKVNPHQTNLVVATDDQYINYKLVELGFTAQSPYYNKYKDVDPLLYQSTLYNLSPYLVSKLFLKENKRLVQPIMDAVLWDTRNWLLEARDTLHTIKFIKDGDVGIIKAVINDFGLEPDDFEPELKPHQLQSLALYIVLGYGFNFGEMRTGKTPPTILYAYATYLKKLQDITDPEGVDTILVACPNSIKFTWLNEIGKFTNPMVKRLSCVVEGTKPKKIDLWNSPSIFKIGGYATFRADIGHVHEAIEGKSYGLILDEIQRVKNDSKQTRAITSLMTSSNPPEFCFGLTGTFVSNKPVDVARPCGMIAPHLVGKNYNDFVEQFCWTNRSNYGNKPTYVSGYKRGALETIRDRIARVSIRAMRKDVGQVFGLEISPQILEMGTQQVRVHKDVQNLLRAELETTTGWTQVTINGFLPKLLKLTQITDGFVYLNGEAFWLDNNPKLKWIEEFLREYLWNIKKVVIYSRFKAVLYMLEQTLKDYGVVSVHGDVKPIDRTRLVDQFRYQDDTSIMLMNPSVAAGSDLNPAHYIIFYDRKYFLEDNLQGESRITGHNQDGDSTIIPLVCRDSIDYALEYEVLPLKRRHAAIVQGDEMPNMPVEGSGALTLDDLRILVG